MRPRTPDSDSLQNDVVTFERPDKVDANATVGFRCLAYSFSKKGGPCHRVSLLLIILSETVFLAMRILKPTGTGMDGNTGSSTNATKHGTL